MHKVFGYAALLGFMLSAGAHISALFGIDVEAHFPLIWLLHLGIFMCFVPFLISLQKHFPQKPKITDLRTLLPRWAYLLLMVIMAYAMINFFVAMPQGSTTIEDGKYLLQSHGKTLRELTASEYSVIQANSMRLFSGHWLVFYYVPFVYFIFGKKK